MSDAPALEALLAHVEATTDNDRDLFWAIGQALVPAGEDESEGLFWSRYGFHVGNGAWLHAAIALCERVLPDVVWSVRGNADLVRGHKAEALLSCFDSERVCFRDIGDVSHFTPALALLAAILRAKIAEMTP